MEAACHFLGVGGADEFEQGGAHGLDLIGQALGSGLLGFGFGFGLWRGSRFFGFHLGLGLYRLGRAFGLEFGAQPADDAACLLGGAFGIEGDEASECFLFGGGLMVAFFEYYSGFLPDLAIILRISWMNSFFFDPMRPLRPRCWCS